ncbi:ATP-grasp domain-containing protein [Pendulispora albinea]|uniref:ATP-grasp domain-containing protein n=1 Tax=Pendulispora albinea TaxID=2741071 RepID=A0ABZ2LZP8_9BACT
MGSPSRLNGVPDDPNPRPSKPRKVVRVAVVHNTDYEDASPEGDPGYAARADVKLVARIVADQLSDERHESQVVAVDGDLVLLRDRLLQLEPDCVFNLCESLAGDARLESAVPLLVETLGIPCTGSPPEALSRALYKDRVKESLQRAGVPTPSGCVLRRPDDPYDLPFPAIVKPVHEDGSVGITQRSVVTNEPELRAVVAETLAVHCQPALVEQYVEGRELNVAMLGFPTARVLPLCEIDFSELPEEAPRIVSYDAKWKAGSIEDRGTRPVHNPELPSALAARVRRVAVDAFRALGLRDYGRVDIRLAPSGVPYVIDVNPNCDLSPNAGMARAAAAVGIDYAALLKLVVRYAVRRRSASKAPLSMSRKG